MSGIFQSVDPDTRDVRVDYELLSAQDTEKALLASVIWNNDLIYECSDLKPDDFFLRRHQAAYKAVWDLITENGAADPLMVAQRLGGKADDLALIEELDDRWHVYQKTVAHHVEKLVDLARRRRLVNLMLGAIAQAHDNSETTRDCLSVTYDRILTLAGENSSQKSLRLDEFSFSVYESIRTQRARPAGVIGLPTGIEELDAKTTGLQPSEYWVIGAYTGEGKTSFAEQVMAENLKQGTPVLFFSQEMTKESVLRRLMVPLANLEVTARQLRNPRELSENQMAIVEGTKEVIDKWPLWVNDASSFEASQLVAHAHMMIHRHKIRLVVVDYLQLVRAPGEKKYEQVSNASASLRQLAKSERIPVVAISQLSRPEGRVKRAPTMFDLKESGQIEQDAHTVCLLYRPVSKKQVFTGSDWIIIGKQREGPTGGVPVEFDPRDLVFKPRARRGEESDDELF